jgi:hypothetical protein
MDGENVQQSTQGIPQLTQFQVRFLTKLAQGKTKQIVTCGGTERDKNQALIDRELQAVKELVELKFLVLEVAEYDKIVKLAKLHVGDDREIYPVVLTVKGQIMFERVKHGKWVN